MTHPTSKSSLPLKLKSLGFPGRKLLVYLGLGSLGIFTAVALIVVWPALSSLIERSVSLAEQTYERWLQNQNVSNPLLLLVFAFLGGIIASISPCILALLPVNLSYIGTLNITSRWDAFRKAGLFVLGTVIILSLFGLVSGFAGFVMVDYRGWIHLAVGLLMIVMALWLLNLVQLPLPAISPHLPQAGPLGVGVTFALVSSPCASPVLFSVLAAAGTSGSQWLSVLTMFSYGLGYTLLIFLASLFTGLTKQSRRLLRHSETIVRLGALALLLTGGYYLYHGAIWF
ncbi:Cytochrome c biogenesis protein [Gloeomargarita lithophora Alchichica-D10]|uniref:Cytochrome c biogenesis protein n=1 Tax=Gloeomargarita lithophora Alchichica-D10 TaxID=1188229 RepID=A0A1J0AA11_9CYAN|nr:cytochrome c biogenesis protein CcdA [Gloeomargarita lithophora]APB32776.1 Cytochrome c biogenesis protein [Gloeomargarita lithophora Alchichica-D10]